MNESLTFTLKSLFLTVSVTCFVLFAYNYGLKRGQAVGYQQGIWQGRHNEMDVFLINVQDLVLPPTLDSYQGLMDEVCSEIIPYSWSKNGGSAEIFPQPENGTITVRHTIQGFKEIEEFLRNKRSKRKN